MSTHSLSDSLDGYDRRILDELQRDGRVSNQELADRIGLSPSPCLRRVRALEDAGFIQGYRAMVDARRMGYGLMVILHIAMDEHTDERFANFEAAITALPNVLECLIITGQSADFQLKLLVRDMDEYEALLLRTINRIDGVTASHTSFVLRKVLDRQIVPTAAAQ
ncbi:Lrp/AsnC family transcriptional regulator [Larsenimonas rhizosphaerae]|uniref:Lrp/AsnC family transcriptional regulator n=1 Tax=Larsenimonas rhizosphaerae TaxID=2944682 RepID=UPI0020331D82|nr:Lrp/AsnC family transcriptional regulator [Larsenimonas rhizosphaerae]MCM2130517.1 Lrp/AsnC family transcriptional regulator [Larsenimonas rhizosphaerae]